MNQADLLSKSTGIELPSQAAAQIPELLTRLQSENYEARAKNRTRRQDGEIVISEFESIEQFAVQIRLNSYDSGKCGVVDLKSVNGRVSATGLMIRERVMGGDDRELIAIPQGVFRTDLPTVENLIYGACQCVARGSVLREDDNMYGLFLPSIQLLPSFDEDFEICKLPPRY